MFDDEAYAYAGLRRCRSTSALALDAVGGQDAIVDQISAGVDGGIDTLHVARRTAPSYAGATAKAAVLAQAAGDDPPTSAGWT